MLDKNHTKKTNWKERQKEEKRKKARINRCHFESEA